jgi:hypothetical protein
MQWDSFEHGEAQDLWDFVKASGSLNLMRRNGASNPLREQKTVRTTVWSQIKPVDFIQTKAA